jgi:hypothetical protein
MRFAKVITFVGIALLVVAWVSAVFIPTQARSDFSRLVRDSGGSLSTPGDYMGMYQQMCASRRMLQDLYVGVAGLICLSIGLAGWTKQVEPGAAPNDGPAALSGSSRDTEGPSSVC